MQVDTEPFLINMINFDGKKVLIWSTTVDKGKARRSSSAMHERSMKMPKTLPGKWWQKGLLMEGRLLRLSSLPPMSGEGAVR
jgi:hypothetical protein